MAEFGTLPLAVRGTVPALTPVPLHTPFAKNVYVTVPVAVNPSLVLTEAVSYAEAPVVSVPDQGAFVAASKTTVAVFEVPGATEKGSHGDLDPP